PPERRAALLDRACAGDPARRERAERLLGLAEADGFLERPPLGSVVETHAVATMQPPGRTIGAYRLLRRIGAGGSGEVWLAERSEGGFRQRAAVKIVRDAHGSLHERFAAEREILASLTHPGIARLYDGGVEPDGCAYMVMEYVEGEHLVAYADAHTLPLAERLALFLQVCDAVAYAHTRLVVHRDIKPANILVTADGHAKLLDFGIAKLICAEPALDATRTLHLSPAYAAPEQLTGDYVSTATDVYALGVTLFELLTGRLPWADHHASLATAVKRLLEAPTPAPSRAAAASAPVPARALRGDLDAIVARALRKAPAARYADARALADDLRRHLERHPVLARAGVRSYVVRRYLRRHWLAFATAAVVFAAMAAAMTAVTWQARRTQLEAQRAAAMQSFMTDLFRMNSSRQPDPLQARQTTVRELLDIGAARIENALDDAPDAKLALLRTFAELYGELGLFREESALQHRAIELDRRHYGDDSLELARDLVELRDASTDSATEAAYAEAAAILDRHGDTHSMLRGTLLTNLAALNSTSDVAAARAQAREAVAILGAFPDSAELAQAFYLLGMIDYYGGHSADAIPSLRRAIEISREVVGTGAPMLPAYYWTLANAQSDVLQHADAEASARTALALALANHSEKPTDAVRAGLVLADVLARTDRFKEALATTREARRTALAIGEVDDFDFQAYTLWRAGAVEGQAGALEDGLADAERALAVRREQKHESPVSSTLQTVAELLIESGRENAALDDLAEARAIQQRFGLSPSRRNAMLSSRALLALGRTDEARAFVRHMLPREDDRSASAQLWSLRHDLAEAEIALQDGDAEHAAARAAEVGRRLRESALAPTQRALGADAALLEGRAHLRRGDAERARPLLADALAVRDDLYLPDSPKIAEAALALA
ncbi:MAG TPA: serine/threonine-protein kinase, partial [Dokdonella sp.]